ncbi:Inner membrane protein YhhQ [Granulosicoccus antarcticus IMCC3135]|uniref:Queuosine precursor transporter n=2 Tax=Granulosicoccus TaxID=437504 RepID=A0A2Z2NMW7_9GAMM|nr:Inner membrane protein YhhQ [Granulosicoccus antarcticus IMCC3135]
MAMVVGASNYLVAIPINDWLVWGALTYPLAFLVNDLVNRFYGAAQARKVVYVGFAVGVALSLSVESIDQRIAIASGTAFLVAQLLDVAIFNRFRVARWWIAPSVSSGISAIVDTSLFFGIAFAGTGLPWQQWAIGDLGVKWSMAALSVLIYGWLASRLAAPSGEAAASAAKP